MTKRILMLATVALTAGLLAHLALAQPPDDDATCAVSATVDGIMEWEDNFPPIDLGTMTSQTDVLTGDAQQTLYTNGDVDIDADQTTAAQLDTAGGDTLYTEYGLEYDGDGLTATGGSNVAYIVYSSFLSTPSAVTHFAGDGAVEVTLQARASSGVGDLPDAGNYSATQTLTASWSS